jgi:UDP-GlcNAc:undecaprenyl-phosphate GlcNAc-1-phosphate transferase
MSALAALVALPAAALVIWLLLRTGLAGRLVAAPRDDRWHQVVTPKLGGVGIFAGILGGVGTALATGAIEPTREVGSILVGCGILFAAGLADDRFHLSPIAKISAQVAAAGAVVAGGVRAELFDNEVLRIAIPIVWLIGMTNAFNLLDNMDGLAATLAAIACLFFAVDAAFVHPNPPVLALAAAVGFACLGFLPFNLRPSRPAAMFMGDSGSQVLGFALAALGLTASWKVAGTTVATLLLPILVLAVPILDTTLVSIVRLLEGRPITQGGRDHTSHRLVYRGLSEKRAVVLLAVVAAALGATSLAYNVLDNQRLTLVGVLLTFALLVQFASFLGEVERDPAGLHAVEGPRLLRTFVVHRRRLLDTSVDAALVVASFTAAYMLTVGGSGTTTQRHLFLVSVPIVLAARYVAFILFGLYRGVWRYAGARDAVSVVAAVAVSGFVAFGAVAATRNLSEFPKSVFVVDVLLCTVLVGASRFGERALHHALGRLRRRSDRRRTVIVGAGRAGRSLLRELRETPGEVVVGFVDDDPRLQGRRLQGVPVVGSLADVDRILSASGPDAVFVTIPAANRERLDLVVAACERAGVPCRFVRREIDLDPRVVLGAATE